MDTNDNAGSNGSDGNNSDSGTVGSFSIVEPKRKRGDSASSNSSRGSETGERNSDTGSGSSNATGGSSDTDSRSSSSDSNNSSDDGGRSATESGSSDSNNGSESGRGTGNASSATSGSGPTDYTGRRGRHPRECICERCNQKRNQTPSVLDGGKPREVSFDKLQDSESTSTAKGVEREALALVYDVGFELPRFLLPKGTADHWPLEDEERDALVDKTERLLKMMPKRSHTKMMKTLEKIVPPIALIATAAVIVSPRIQETKRRIDILKGRHNGTYPTPQGGSSAITTGSASTNQASDISVIQGAIREATGRSRIGPLEAAGFPFQNE